MERCKYLTKSKSRCKAPAVRDGSGACIFHHPARKVVKPAWKLGKWIGKKANPVEAYRKRKRNRSK